MLARWCLFSSLLIMVAQFAMAASNPVPFIDATLNPGRKAPGTGSFTLALTGTGFVPTSIVRWDGHNLVTTFVNSSRLAARVPQSNLTTPTTALVTVFNPTPGGGSSNVSFFEVTQTTPTAIFFERRTALPALPSSLATGDFNGDGKLDFAAATGANISILSGNGDGTFEVSSFPSSGSSLGALISGDFDSDGKLDLAFLDPSTNLLHVLLGDGHGNFTPASTARTGSNPVAAVAGDFNGDGKLDLAVANHHGGSVSIMLGNGDGTFSKKATPKTASLPKAISVGDFDRDGKLDLAVVNSGNDTVSILLGRGDGTFVLKSSPASGPSPYAAAVADFNHDGKLDLAVTNYCDIASRCSGLSGTISVMLGSGDGTFSVKSIVLPNLRKLAGIAAGDFNSDGRIDLAITSQNEVKSIVLLGNGNGTFRTRMVVLPNGVLPDLVIPGDFNNDGRLDFAVSTNFAVGEVRALCIKEQSPVAFYPDVLTFPPQTIGTTSTAKTVRFANIGVVPLHIFDAVTVGFFAGTNDCPATLPAGASCTFTETFTPGFKGLTGGAVIVTDDALGVKQNGFLDGVGK